jgi:hypothetical protein
LSHPEDGNFMGWSIRNQGGNHSIANDTIKLWIDTTPNNATVLYKKVSLKTNFLLTLQVKAPKMNLDNYNKFGKMRTTGDFKVGFISDNSDFTASSSYPLDSYGMCGSNYFGSRNTSASHADGTSWQCYDFEYGMSENAWYTIIISVQRNPFTLSTALLDENGRYLGGTSTSGKDDPRFDNLTYAYITSCAEGDFSIRNISEVPSTGDFTFTPVEPCVNSPVVFNATEQGESYRSPYIYVWDFGDGNTTTTQERSITHHFTSSGCFNVTLTTTYYYAGFSTTTKTITVSSYTFLSMFTSCSSITAGSAVNVHGRLYEADGTALSNQTIVLSYSFEAANAATPISSAFTDENGEYFMQWINSASGTFTLHVAWFGDSAHPSVGNSTTLSFLPYLDKNAFVVESNSTVTSLAFNSTTSELSFTVSGPQGTTGYVKTTIAKTLLPNATDLKVYLDGKQLNYTLTDNGDIWLLTFTYSHSTHQVAVYLPMDSAENHAADTATAAPNPDTTAINYWLLAGIVVAIIVIDILAAFILRGTKKPAENYAFEA